MSRELRKVPANWQHPKKEDGNFQPMFNEFYGDALNEWFNNHNKWLDGTHPDLLEDPSLKEKLPFFAMWDGDAPEVNYYHTKKYSEDELTHIQLYETTTEGTPVSPVFKADELEKLCEWAEKNVTVFADIKTTKEKWMNMLSNNFVHHSEGNVMFM